MEACFKGSMRDLQSIDTGIHDGICKGSMRDPSVRGFRAGDRGSGGSGVIWCLGLGAEGFEGFGV